jgi:hypothetical protein
MVGKTKTEMVGIKCLPLTHATSNLGIWLNLKLVLYLKDLANPKDNADLAPNCL